MLVADSVDDWRALVKREEATARLTCKDKRAASKTRPCCGAAIEYALKAVIMYNSGMNRWPTRDEDPTLYIHNLGKLAQRAGVIVQPGDPVAAAWATMLPWDRLQDYDPRKTSRIQAQSNYDATFGEQGVIEWLNQNYLPKR